MTDILKLEIEPLGALLLRGWGELDPAVGAPYSRAWSLPIPTPSTVAGSLASLIFAGSEPLWDPQSREAPRSWLEEFDIVFRRAGIVGIRGPYLVAEDTVFVPDPVGKPVKDPRYLTFTTIRGEKKARPVFERRLGIGLERGKKEVIEGMIYEACYLSGFEIGENGKWHPAKTWGFCADVLHDGQGVVRESKMLRFGGKGGSARLRLEEGSCIEGLLRDWSGPGLVVSPLLISESGDCGARRLEIEKGVISILGMGYSLMRGRRKPIEKAVFWGSVIKADQQDWEGIYDSKEDLDFCMEVKGQKFRTVKGQGTVGYGTVLPLRF